jgi:peptidoglycan hydrolase CwlO-like protein
MKELKWWVKLADIKPVLFSVAMLLTAVATLSLVIQNREKKIDLCEENNRQLRIEYERKRDSIAAYYAKREIDLNNEVKKNLQGMIDDYKDQIDEQKKLNHQISSTINENKKIINKAKKKLKNI